MTSPSDLPASPQAIKAQYDRDGYVIFRNVLDADLIRTKVNLIPESVPEIRVVDIVGLDKQADGGTHVHTTDEVGRIRVVKTESKGKGNKRIRIEIVDG